MDALIELGMTHEQIMDGAERAPLVVGFQADRSPSTHAAVMQSCNKLPADPGEVLLNGVGVHAGGNRVLVRHYYDGVPGQLLVPLLANQSRVLRHACPAFRVAGSDHYVVRGLKDPAHRIGGETGVAVGPGRRQVGGD